MGRYLKQQYEKADTIKALSKLELSINDEFKKLSDKVKNLTLSHNRQEKLLKRVLDYLDSLGFIESDNGDFYPLYDAILAELNNPLYRCCERKKGGKKCV